MTFSFTRFKDRISGTANALSKGLGAAPKPVRAAGYGVLRGLLWLIYFFPRSPLRKTARNFALAVGQDNPRRLYGGFVGGLTRTAYRMELLGQGRGGEIDALLQIPEQDRLEGLVAEGGGALLLMPHCHGSLLMIRGLAERYPLLFLMRAPKDEARAAMQKRFFDQMRCEVVDVRRSNEASVARTVLRSLRKGMIVIGAVDRIRKAPSKNEPVSKTEDNVRVTVFGQAAGFVGWPARFAAKAGVPILPVMVEHTEDAIRLHLGEPITAGEIQATTQAWVIALEGFFNRFPLDWIFVYDKHWARLLEARANQRPPSGFSHSKVSFS